MAKKCFFCKAVIDDDSVVDVCRRCGIGVWGDRMFSAIVQNMSAAREAGDLYQGSVTEFSESTEKGHKKVLPSEKAKQPEKTVQKVNDSSFKADEPQQLVRDGTLYEQENIRELGVV